MFCHYLLRLLACLMVVVLFANGQQHYQYFSNENVLNSNLLLDSSGVLADYTARDPKSNRGPILFPPSPVASAETTGVIVGASGYGFVPDNNANKRISFLS